jgi:ParB-like chromosome segregation protein Spo0J
MGKHTREVLAPHQVMPSLTEEEFQALKADIAENGVMVPIVKDGEGNLIDGRHRERAVRELRQEGLEVPDCPEEVRADLTTAEEKQQLAIRLNMQRRHLSRDDKSRVTKAALKMYPHWSNNRLAAMLGISDNTVRTERLYLESTSQIEKLERLEGAGRRTRPRSREREEEAKSAEPAPQPKRNEDEETARQVGAAYSRFVLRDPKAVAEVAYNRAFNAKDLQNEAKLAQRLAQWFTEYAQALAETTRTGLRAVEQEPTPAKNSEEG